MTLARTGLSGCSVAMTEGPSGCARRPATWQLPQREVVGTQQAGGSGEEWMQRTWSVPDTQLMEKEGPRPSSGPWTCTAGWGVVSSEDQAWDREAWRGVWGG